MILLFDNGVLELIKDFSNHQFLGAMSLRIILLFLVVLVVKILFAAYKYNIKMAHFFQSREMVIKHSGVMDITRVKAFAELYASDKIDFVVDELGNNGLLEIIKSMFGK